MTLRGTMTVALQGCAVCARPRRVKKPRVFPELLDIAYRFGQNRLAARNLRTHVP